MQDCQYVLSHLLSVCNLLVQGPNITYNNTVCQDGFKFYCGVLRWILFISSSLTHWTSKRDNILLFSMPTLVTWYFCFLAKFVTWYPCFLKNIQGKGSGRFFPFQSVFKLPKISLKFMFTPAFRNIFAFSCYSQSNRRWCLSLLYENNCSFEA